MPLTICSASLDDLPVILALEQRAASAAHWSAEEYERLVSVGLVLVAEQAGQVAGFVCAKATAGEWEIENVVVAAEFLRQGIASRLLCALIEHTEQGTASRILLEVRESNHPARRLYEKHGFHEVGRRRNYYNHPREDAILYERRSQLLSA
jgi:[ribosomal protein S18]-alanine N-acetyltransferase